MKLAIMQPYLFPYIGYWQLINAVDKFIIYDDVAYIKQGFINRNFILVNKKSHRFTLRVRKASPNKKINELTIGNNIKKILKTLYFSYKKAPYFEQVYPLIEKILRYENKNLAIFVGNSIIQIVKYLEIDTEIEYSSKIEKDNTLKGQDKIIAMCKALNAKVYINPIGGLKLYNKKDFLNEGIELKFLRPLPIKYKQFDNEFVPNLSIIDVLMFNSKETVKKFLERYELI